MSMLQGVAHGKMIELETDLGLPEGQAVTVVVQPVLGRADETTPLPPGEGLRRAFGAWADDTQGLDEYLEWNRRQREISRPEIEP
jgi:hypothetical protein